jgi:formylglycine-generating enzyme required for sulfatase activity/regulator of sirC expression with transglutaminase-like and TPR domain
MTVLRTLFFLLCLVFLVAEGLAHAAPDAVSAEAKERLEAVATAPESGVDLTETLLLISAQWDPSIDLAPLRAKIDRLVESVRRQLKAGGPAKETVHTLSRVIHQEESYRYTDRVDAEGIPLEPSELFLHGLITRKRGYCMNLSLLYLIVGERLNLPLFGVALPNHFFVRYQAPDGRINIEATEGGATHPDDFYRRRFEVAASDAFFMRNLSKRETLGAYFSNVGMAHYRDHRPKNAIFYLDLATRINRESLEAHNNLGNIYAEQNRPNDAIRHYTLALEAQPEHVPTLYNLGLAYRQAGKPEQATDQLLKITTIAPGFIPAHQSLVNLYMENGRPFGALLHLKLLMRLDPGNLEVKMGAARVYLGLGKAGLAAEILVRLRQNHPDHPRIAEALAEARYREERYDEAIHLYRDLLEAEPDNLKAHVQLGWTYYKVNRLREAIAWTRRGLRVAGKEPEFTPVAEMNLGLYHVLTGKWDAAKDWYLKALQHPAPNIAAGIIADLDEAAADVTALAEVDFFKGWVLLRAGQEPAASEHLKRYLEKRPGGDLAGEARRLMREPLPPPAPGGATSISAPAQKATEENMVDVPAGHFFMGANGKGADEIPEHRVYLDAYRIDRYEVSAARFAEFLNDVGNVKGFYLDNMYGTLFYDGRFHPRPGLEKLPVNNVNWHGASAYCRWKGKRLPSEAEWEKAARGTDRRLYPWGNERPNDKQARFNQTWTEELAHGVMLPVDTLPEGRSPFGAHHMAGNVKEWVDDWYDREYYVDPSNHTNPTGPIGGEFKVVRGGSWRDLAGFIYTSFRNNSYAETRLDDYGFRCAASPAPREGRIKKPRQEARAAGGQPLEGS